MLADQAFGPGDFLGRQACGVFGRWRVEKTVAVVRGEQAPQRGAFVRSGHVRIEPGIALGGGQFDQDIEQVAQATQRVAGCARNVLIPGIGWHGCE